MRNVSEAYQQAVIAKELNTRITGIVTTPGRIYSFDDSIVVPGSLSISRKAINNSSFQYGAAVASEANLTLILPDADRYSMYDAVLELHHYTALPGGGEEHIKLGVWNVSECTKTKRLVTFKCYDNMLRFDAEITDDTTAAAYDLLAYACEKCGVEPSQTEDQIQALPNGNLQLRVQADEVKTYRDLICYIGMITGTFARINEDGKLVLQTFMKTPAGELIKRQVLSSKISDFKTTYQGVEARFIADMNYAPYEIIDTSLSGLVLDLGDIPIVRGLPETKYEVLQAIFDDLKQISFTPVELSTTGNPAIEPGDLLTVRNANLTNDDVTTLITSTSWTHHRQMKLVSAGSNPRLAGAKDKSSKQLSVLESTIQTKDVVIVSYTNADDYTVKQSLVPVLDMGYTTVEGCKPIFLCIIQFDLSHDGIVEFNLYNGLVAIPHAGYKGYFLAGLHFITLFHPDSASGNERKSIRVLAKTYRKEDSAIRNQAAEIKTLQNAIEAVKTTADLSRLSYVTAEPDQTEPVMTIAAQEIKAIIYAQGISTKAEWDGDLAFTDYMSDIPVTSSTAAAFTDTMTALAALPDVNTFAETIAAVTLNSVFVSGFTGGLSFNEKIRNYIVNTDKAADYTYNTAYVTTNETYALSSENVPEPQTVVTNAIDLSNATIAGIENVTVSCTGNPVFALSFDSGQTWKAYNGTGWVALEESGTGMKADTLEAISVDDWQEQLASESSFRLRFTLTALEDTVTEVRFNFINN